MYRILKWGVALALAVVTLCAPAAALAAEATLTEVVEAVKVGNVLAEEDRLKLTHLEELLRTTGELSTIQETLVHDVGSSGVVTKKLAEVNEKLAAPILVDCTSGCSAGGGSTVNFGEAASKEFDGDFGALSMLLWLIVGVLLGQVAFAIWDRRAAQ